ncbi:flagellar hook protein FlgE [Silvibacterium bohemicum]|uniref:Flagellar hook protein FlgE n=1 Tax=Silvibacterium bohemicum TaxID=1577686 RepID=A0A841K3T3_9BACT|nr:flagellar hook protein FlgE [Silvibacterium bohemicum]MBB6147227.1 flagellar hook protein FlgE [Silvibacterium bohemicum]
MSSFSIPLTGLESSSTALNTIANNLSNMNTTAFKSQNVSFSDLFYQQIGTTGSGDLLEVGAGTQIASTSTDFSGGSINPVSGNPTDVALSGNGFFVLQNGGTSEYTRDGSFTLSPTGFLTTQSGLQVMGYPAANGVVNTNSPLVPLQIPVGQVEQPAATANMSITANLDSSAAVGTTFPAQIKLYDSLGTPQLATVTFTNTGTNTWSYSIALPAGAATSGTNLTGNLTFNSNGDLTAPAANVAGISFTGLSDGASNLTFNWNLYGANGQPTITQFSQPSAAPATSQDGFTSGQYQSFTVDASGQISATFSNGQTSPIGQLAVANVTNPEGLTLLGGNNYETTLASGSASVATAGTGGLGTIEDDALEQSNVNISAEFSNLIIAQQAYEASSKAVTTFDTVSQDTINMIH